MKTAPGTAGLLKKVRLLRRCAPRNDKKRILVSLRAIRRIARQSQPSLWDFFNNPTVPSIAGDVMDLKIEIRKLNALHEATIRFEHAIRNVGETTWRDFTPSRFIYAFFTFNGIYSLDWETSFKEKKAIKWSPDSNNRFPSEEDQFKAYLRYIGSVLKPDTARIFSEELAPKVTSFGVKNPVEELRAVDLTNATTELEKLAKQLPGQFGCLLKGQAKPEDFFATGCAVLQFVYKVRCNMFHGSKARVQLLDPAQQRRLLIYTATLITTNSLLFRVAKEADVGWRDVTVDFTLQPPAGGA